MADISAQLVSVESAALSMADSTELGKVKMV